MMLFIIAALSLLSADALVLESCGIVDLTYPFNVRTIYWPTAKPFRQENVFTGETSLGFFYSARNYEAAEHGGTHIDAPYHFAETGHKVDEIPLDKFVGEGCVVDVVDKASRNSDYQITKVDLETVPLESRCIVLLKTGWGRFWPDKTKYLGTETKNTSLLHFPGLSFDGAQHLVDKGVRAVGIDTASIDPGQSTVFKAHQILGAANVPVIENVANLELIPARGTTIVVLPMKMSNSTGGPARVVALNVNHTCLVN